MEERRWGPGGGGEAARGRGRVCCLGDVFCANLTWHFILRKLTWRELYAVLAIARLAAEVRWLLPLAIANGAPPPLPSPPPSPRPTSELFLAALEKKDGERGGSSGSLGRRRRAELCGLVPCAWWRAEARSGADATRATSRRPGSMLECSE